MLKSQPHKPIYPVDSWRWSGKPGHFICADKCLFHLSTVVGPWTISTVGECKMNNVVVDINPDGKYETMIFRSSDMQEMESYTANDPGDADMNHINACMKWSHKHGTSERPRTA